jgi:outer membrane lipoprotein carrier protein
MSILKVRKWALYGVIVFCFMPLWAVAQDDAFACRGSDGRINATEARHVVRDVQKQYAKIDSLSASFVQRSFIVALAEGEQSSGIMSFSKPGRMRWSYKAPREQEVLVRDGVMSLYQIDTQQVIIQDVKEVLLSAVPIAFMMGIGDLDRDFRVVSACKTASSNLALTLEAKVGQAHEGENDELGGFILLVDLAKKTPIGAKITSVGGNITEIVFSNQVFNSISSESSRFVLDYPTSVDLVDRR